MVAVVWCSFNGRGAAVTSQLDALVLVETSNDSGSNDRGSNDDEVCSCDDISDDEVADIDGVTSCADVTDG